MSVIKKKKGGATILLDSDMVANTTQDVKEELLALIRDGRTELILDFEKVEMVDSLGIGVLVGTHNSLKKVDGSLQLINVAPDIYHLFITMRLNDYLDIKSI